MFIDMKTFVWKITDKGSEQHCLNITFLNKHDQVPVNHCNSTTTKKSQFGSFIRIYQTENPVNILSWKATVMQRVKYHYYPLCFDGK